MISSLRRGVMGMARRREFRFKQIRINTEKLITPSLELYRGAKFIF